MSEVTRRIFLSETAGVVAATALLLPLASDNPTPETVVRKFVNSDRRTVKEIEIDKLFDNMRSLRTTKEGLAAKEERQSLMFEGEQIDAELLATGLLAFYLVDFKALVDGEDPFYVDMILEYEQLPGIADVMEAFDRVKAEGRIVG